MKLAFKYIVMHLKSQLEYRSSFIMSLFAQVLPTILSASMVFVLLEKFNFGDKFNVYEVMLGVAIVHFGHSASECLGRGFDKFSDIIKKGTLDLMLIKPRSVYIQIFGSNIEFSKLSRILGSIILFVVAVKHLAFPFTILNVLFLIWLLIASVIIYISLYILAACFCFKSIEGLEFTHIFTDGSHEFGQYPMGLFRREVLIMFTFIIPLACVNYYPIKYIMGESNNILYLLSPLFCFVILGISVLIFNRCLKHYASTGS